MATSQNGFAAGNRAHIHNPAVPGTNIRFPGGLRKGPTGDLLLWVALQLHHRVENGGTGYGMWGYAYRAIRGATSLSNHASGTAIDWHAPRHPLGKAGTFNAAQVREIRKILAEAGGCVRWGGDYTGRKDEMHFEIVASEAACARALAAVTPGAPAATQPIAPPAPIPRRLHQEDTEMFIETPEPAPGTDIRQWPRKRFYYGFDPKGGWGGNGIIRINFGPRGGCVHLARWWQRNPDWSPNNRNRMHFWDHPLTPGGHPFAIAEDWQIDLRTAASGIEFDLAAPDGVHIFTVYQK